MQNILTATLRGHMPSTQGPKVQTLVTFCLLQYAKVVNTFPRSCKVAQRGESSGSSARVDAKDTGQGAEDLDRLGKTRHSGQVSRVGACVA